MMRNKVRAVQLTQGAAENRAKWCQVSGQCLSPRARFGRENHSICGRLAVTTQVGCAPPAPAAEEWQPFRINQDHTLEGRRMASKYLSGILIVVLCMALARPAAADKGRMIEAVEDRGPIMGEFVEATAVAAVMTAVVIHELSVVLALCTFAAPIHAQATQTTAASPVPPWYDIAKEVTLTGTLSSVVQDATPQMNLLGGSHLIIETTAGKIDAALGGFAMKGEGALSVTPGQRVQVTGVMKTIRDQQVFVTRLVLANGQVYKIRNEHGFVLRPLSRQGRTNSEAMGGRR
jgi:hypothetical protein